jgi:hypothetical protein
VAPHSGPAFEHRLGAWLAEVVEPRCPLRTAVDWDVIRTMPCKIRIPKSARRPPTFYEQDAMRRLIDAAAEIDTRTHALVLLGSTAVSDARSCWASNGRT